MKLAEWLIKEWGWLGSATDELMPSHSDSCREELEAQVKGLHVIGTCGECEYYGVKTVPNT